MLSLLRDWLLLGRGCVCRGQGLAAEEQQLVERVRAPAAGRPAALLPPRTPRARTHTRRCWHRTLAPAPAPAPAAPSCPLPCRCSCATQVRGGQCVAVYAEGDERKNGYYLLQVGGP